VTEKSLNIEGVCLEGMDALSAHVVVIDPGRSQTILQQLNSLLEKRFNIAHATIQIEGYHSESNSF